jgi:hypothetical protein
MSTIRSTAWRKRGSTNDPVSSCRRRCHRHCHHCCNWRDPWHRTLALARDLSARQLILAPHTIAFAKPLNSPCAYRRKLSCDGDYFSLLGEMIEDTATRYYYRLRSSDELTFVDKKSPAIHIAGQAPLTL